MGFTAILTPTVKPPPVSDRNMTEVDNGPLDFSRVSNSVHSSSELMARKTLSAQLVLWSGKARMTVLIV